MSDMTYKKITEVEQLSFLNDDAKLFINQDNAIKQYSAKQLLNEYVPESTNPHQYLTTDADGNKVWENKLTYSSMEDVPFLEEKVWTGEETESFTATRSVDVGDKITLYVDDIPYTGTLENFHGMGWIIHFDEEYPELSAAIKTAIITPPKMAFKTDTPQGIIGKISATVLTDVIHPIDNKYLAFNISQGSTSPESISINGQASDSKGFKTVSINGGKASGLHSIAFHEGSEASGLNTFAAAGGKAEGPHSVAFGYNAHSMGQFSMAIGENNIADEKYLFVVGNGTSDKAKANAHTLDISGNARFAGNIYVQGTGTDDLQDAKKLATEEYVDTKVAELVDSAPETLDTLNEIATAFSEHAEVVDTLNQAIGNKVDKTDYPIESSSNQYLTTDAEGNKVWEEKLAYAVNERKELVTLTTISEGMMLDALFTPSVGDTCLIIYNDQEYHGTCNTADMVSTIQMTEGENFPLTSLKLNCLAGYNLTDSEISALSGTIQIFVTTNTIHPIDNAFIDLPIRKGEQYGAVCLGVENSVKATNLLSAAINQGKAHGQTSLAINSGTTRGENSFAQGLATIASGQSQMVIGAKNIEDTTNTYIQIAGNGSDERSNAYALDWNGNAYFDGDVFVQGDGKTLSFDGAKKLATEEYVEEKLLDPDLVRATAFNELADTVKGLDKYCAFVKQGNQINLGNVKEYSKMQEMLSGANKFHATLAVTYVNEEGLLISETCYAKSVMSAVDMQTGSKPYVNFSFETFDGETIKFRWNADNTISNVVTIAATPAEEAEV